MYSRGIVIKHYNRGRTMQVRTVADATNQPLVHNLIYMFRSIQNDKKKLEHTLKKTY